MRINIKKQQMKQLLLTALLILTINFIFAQATEGYVEYQKSKQPAAVISLPYPESWVNKALNDYLSKKGSKVNDIKGFKTFRNTSGNDQDPSNADMYMKIERKSRQEKDQTTISLMVGSPNDNISSNNPGSQMNMQQAKDFLNQLIPIMESYNLEMSIRDQNDLINKEEKKYKSLVDDGNDLEKKRSSIENKISDNKQEQLKQSSIVEKQKQNLTELVGKRKP
jgi:hypothetical protein